MEKTTILRQLLNTPQTEFLMEAHDGLSARIVEEAGFKGIWASGLTISAALGVRDNNEASWTQVLEVVEFMNDATSLPILLDGDTGYGNFNNARRLVQKLMQRGIAGVCIEDKLFPKTNSFINSEKQPLADIDEFCGKIRAMKDVVGDDDFVIVARVEAFIAGWGLAEVLKRSKRYREAGADAILIHSKKSTSSEIEEFVNNWHYDTPIIIVPTKYYSTPTEKFQSMGISLVIWANHNLRASIGAMQRVSNQIAKDTTLINVEEKIVPVSEVFRLQGATEYELAEQLYLPTAGKNINAIILAAAQGDKFGDLTKDIPKAMLKVKGKPILSNQIEQLQSLGIRDISVVRGFAKETIAFPDVATIDNDDYAKTTEITSLSLAKEKIQENTIIVYGDLLFKKYMINELIHDEHDITLVVDVDYSTSAGYHEYVTTNIPYHNKLFFEKVQLVEIDSTLPDERINGEFIGIFKVSGEGAAIVKETLHLMQSRKDFSSLRMKDLFMEIIKSHPVGVKFIRGNWLDINTIVDLQQSGDF